MRWEVPLYSQRLDIKSRTWQHRACGIVALKMVIDHFKPRHATHRTFSRLITQGQRSGAYIRNVGWSHRGLAYLSQRYGFSGRNYDWWKKTPHFAFKKLVTHLKKGPVLASIYQNLRPNSHGHLVAVTGFEKNIVFYNDPDSHTRRGITRRASVAKFLRGWKRRVVVVRPRLRGKK